MDSEKNKVSFFTKIKSSNGVMQNIIIVLALVVLMLIFWALNPNFLD